MMELKITSMTPTDRLYAYNQSSQLEGQTGCIGHLRGDFGSGQEFYTSWFDHRREYKTDEFFTLPGSTIGGNTRRTSLRRSLMRWSMPCGRRTGCFSVGAA